MRQESQWELIDHCIHCGCPIYKMDEKIRWPKGECRCELERERMKYNIGDILKDEDGNQGIVYIHWNDGDHCAMENDAAHPNPKITGHWPEDETLEP